MSLTVKSNIAGVLTVFSLTLAVLGFATDRWLIISVDTAKLQEVGADNRTDAIYYGVANGRNRGILKECYDVEPKFIGDIGDRKQSNSCAWIEFEIPTSSDYSTKSSEYKARIHLVRATTIGAGVAILLLFTTFIIQITAGCCDIQRKAALICGIMCVLSFLLLGGSFACFLIAFFEFEQTKVKDNWHFWAYWPQELKDATTYTLGWSLWVFLVSVVMALAAAFLFFVGYCFNDTPDEGKRPFTNLDDQSYPMDYTSAYPSAAQEVRDRDQRSVISSASGQGRVMKNQLGKRTIDPVTGREICSRINESFEDESSFHGSRFNGRQDHREHDRRFDSRNGTNNHNYYPDRSYYRAGDRGENRGRYDDQYDDRVPRSDSSRYPAEPRRDYNSPRRDSRQPDYKRYDPSRDQYFE